MPTVDFGGRSKPRKYQGYKKANPKNMKKTTKRGAYRKGAKKQMQRRRAPFVETKRRIHSQISGLNTSTGGTPSTNYQQPITGLNLPNNDAFTLLNLASYWRQSHGFEERNVIGDSLYSKWLKLKLQIRWPEGTDMIANPVQLYLITGWVTAPLAFTTNTTITEELATQTDLFQHMTDQLKEYFDEREDFLRFRERTTSNVKILSKRLLKPNLNASIAPPPSQGLLADETTRSLGAVPFVNKTFTWKTNRKMHLSQGKALATGNDAPDPDTQNLYPNNQWLPFAIIYNPEFARMRNTANEDVETIIAYNDIHYYSDS